MIQVSRRGILTGLISLVAAPAIVRADNLMPLRGKPIMASVEGISEGGWWRHTGTLRSVLNVEKEMIKQGYVITHIRQLRPTVLAKA